MFASALAGISAVGAGQGARVRCKELVTSAVLSDFVGFGPATLASCCILFLSANAPLCFSDTHGNAGKTLYIARTDTSSVPRP